MEHGEWDKAKVANPWIIWCTQKNLGICNFPSDMRTSHALLLRLRHDPQFEFCRRSVEYLDRGAPGDRSVVQGDQILRLEHGGMEIVQI